jgi:hypothetical protein
MILTQAETVATKRSTIAWICMMMVLEDQMVSLWWNGELWMKEMMSLSSDKDLLIQIERTRTNHIRLP